MTFDDHMRFPLDEPDSAQGERLAEDLRSSAAGLGTSAAVLIESLQNVENLHELAFKRFNEGLTETVGGINEATQNAGVATELAHVVPQTTFIREACEHGDSSTAEMAEGFASLPENIQKEHDHVPGQAADVRGWFQYVADLANVLAEWWRAKDAQPTRPGDSAEASTQTAEDIGSRRHWLELAKAAPQNSVGWVIAPMADTLYGAVGETAGQGIGKTFEDNKALFHQVNHTPQAMAKAVVAWAKYETEAIQTNEATSVSTMAVGAVLSESDRAGIIWQSYRARLGEAGAQIPADPYDVADEPKPEAVQRYDQTRSTWTAGEGQIHPGQQYGT